MDREAITSRNFRTLCFLAVGFLNVAFLDCTINWNNFLMECGEGGIESEKDMSPLFSGSFHYESKLSSMSFLWCFV